MSSTPVRYERLEESKDCVKVLDLDGRLAFMNANGRARLCIPTPNPFLGEPWVEFWSGRDHVAAAAALQAARDGGIGRFEGSFATFEGEAKWWDVIVVPILGGDGRPEALLAISRDISDRHVTSDRLRSSEQFYRILADALPEKIYICDQGGSVEYVNRPWIEYTGRSFEESLGLGWASCVHEDDRAALGEDWRRAVAAHAKHEYVFRLRRYDGVYRWHITRAEPLAGTDGASSEYVGTTIDIDDQKRTLDALRFLASADESLSDSLEITETLRAVAETAVPALADFCVVALRGDRDRIEVAAIAHADSQTALALEQHFDEHPVMPGDPVAGVIGTGKPLLLAVVDGEHAASDGERDLIRLTGARSAMIVPLANEDGTIGAVGFGSSDLGRTFGDSDLAIARIFARRASSAIERAQTFEREHRIATTLQDAFLPKSLPVEPGFRFDALYVAARAEASVGGDWYDAFRLPDGRIAITLGDVAGSGLRAAVTMGKLRQAMQSVAMVQPFPSAMLDAADLTLRASEDDGIATALAGIFDAPSGSFTYASAGHPSPLLARADGTFVEFVGAGLPIGLRTHEEPGTTTISLAPGSILTLYTDGLVESTRNLEEGDRRLRKALSDPAVLAAPQLARAIFDSVLFDGSHDDVAILTLRAGER